MAEYFMVILLCMSQMYGLSCRYFSKLRGSFWAVYVCVAEEGTSLCLFAVTDSVGVMPMWMGCGTDSTGDFILVSPYWPMKSMPMSLSVRSLHQSSPRLLHRWSARDGLVASTPDPFYGLHELAREEDTTTSTSNEVDVDVTSRLKEVLLQAVRRCTVGEDHVGLLFSGGLDSGLLAWILMTDELAAASSKCSGYTVGFHMEDKKIKNKRLDLDVVISFLFTRYS